MSVIPTNIWIKNYVNACAKNQDISEFTLQETFFCTPLQAYFPDLSIENIHDILMYGGLFAPVYFNQVAKRLNKMEERHLWETVEQELCDLREVWEGNDIDIFIFLINNDEPYFKKELESKNGLAYPDKIILFLDENSSLMEIKKLLTHEYNHVCRLQYLNKEVNKLALKDSIIIEGLAEIAIKLRIGKDAIASFSTLYSEQEAKQYWHKYLFHYLDEKDVNQHQRFLFGDDEIPKRLGYCVGYRILESYTNKNQIFSMNKLLHTPTEDFIQHSSFQMKKIRED